MFEQSFENEDRYTQQSRRSQSPYYDRRRESRGFEDRYDERHRYRGQDSDRRYTRPDYDSELEIERPGQAHFGSRGGSDYGREYNQDGGWQRPYRSQSVGDRYGYEGSRTQHDFRPGGTDYGSYGRGMSDWGRGPHEWGTGSGVGHADWNRFGSQDVNQNQDWGRSRFDQQSQSSSWNEQRNRWPKSYKRSDERIKDDIHEELIRHGRIDASDVEVQVKDGEVSLTGQVASRHDKRIAEELAERVLGVHDVQNQLRVRSPQPTQGFDSQKGGATASMPGSNRMSVAGQQQDPSKSAANTTNK